MRTNLFELFMGNDKINEKYDFDVARHSMMPSHVTLPPFFDFTPERPQFKAFDEEGTVKLVVPALGFSKENIKISSNPVEKIVKIVAKNDENNYFGEKEINFTISMARFKDIDLEQPISASTKDGILTILFRKSENSQRTIDIPVS